MDDPAGKPSNSARDPLEARIRQAAASGRISDADRDIRLRNVASAQSGTELDLIRRELDQLDGGVAPVAVGLAAPATSTPRSSMAGPIAVAVVALLLVGAVVAAGAMALVVFGGDQDAASSENLPEAVPIASEDAEPTADPTIEEPGPAPEISPTGPAGPAYALTGPGIRSLLAAYRAKFATTQVVELAMYDDYVVVRVPVPGTNRNRGWLYRNDRGWAEFGGVMANFPGTEPVDTTTITVPALARNIARARRTLGVEDPSTTYVVVSHRPRFDDRPSVDIHVSNEFRESGYLATRPDGSIERAYPFLQ